MKCVELEKITKENSRGKTRPELCLRCVWHPRVEEGGQVHTVTSWPVDIKPEPIRALKVLSFTGAENFPLDPKLHESVRFLTAKNKMWGSEWVIFSEAKQRSYNVLCTVYTLKRNLTQVIVMIKIMHRHGYFIFSNRKSHPYSIVLLHLILFGWICLV